MSIVEAVRHFFDWMSVPTSSGKINDIESNGEGPLCRYRQCDSNKSPMCTIGKQRSIQPCIHPLASIEDCELADFGERVPDLCKNPEVYFLPGYDERIT